MRNKFKTIIIIFIAILGIGFVADNVNMKSITTDSGFDTNYDSKGHSGSSSRTSSKNSSKKKSNKSNSSTKSNNSSSKSSSSSHGVLYKVILIGVILYYIFILGVILPRVLHRNRTRRRKNKDNSYNFNPEINLEYKPILDEAYKIFVDVQTSWMNFDYDKLRQLVTDDLYNMYYNQLETLKIKGEKNIMEKFNLKEIHMVTSTESNDVINYDIYLSVSFIDYISDSSNNVLRGSNSNPVEMTYRLNFIKSKEDINKCPKCGAEIENGVTICPYCRNYIQGISNKMKLSSKRVISQK